MNKKIKRLHRSEFLKYLTGFTIGAPLLFSSCKADKSSPGTSGDPITLSKPIRWRMVTTWPPKFPILGEGCQRFADLVHNMSDGLLSIQVYGSGELIPALEVFDAVSSGTAQLGSGASYYWAGKIPAAQYFGAVPFGMNTQQMTSWLFYGGGLQLWEEIYAPFDLIPLPAGNTGIQMGGWFRKEILSPLDLVGLKMRIPGLGGKVFERAGGTAVLSSASEIYTNLERGVIDATEWIGPFHDYKMGFQDIAPYYYYPGWHEPGSTLEILINRTAFFSLPPYLQHIVRAASREIYSWTIAGFETENAKTLDTIIKDKKVKIQPFPAEVLKELKNHTQVLLSEVRMLNPECQKVHDAYFAFIEQQQSWSKMTEKEFYNNLMK